MGAGVVDTGPGTAAAERDPRDRILDAAVTLIASGGLAALTTRAVASAARVQAPTLYRLFGDKRGLLDAVAERGLAAFVAQKLMVRPHTDPVRDLGDAWDAFVAFGLANPAVFAIMNDVGASTARSPAVLAGLNVLRERVRRVARAGRLRMQVERAVALIHAAGVGTVATLLAAPPAEQDLTVSTAARDAVLAALVDAGADLEDGRLPALAIGLGAHLGEANGLTPGERLLLAELLDRLARAAR